MRTVYDVGEDDVMFTASDVGWVVGHSSWCRAAAGRRDHDPVEGEPVGAPDAGAFAAVVAERRVTVIFTAPTSPPGRPSSRPRGRLTAEQDSIVAAGSVPGG